MPPPKDTCHNPVTLIKSNLQIQYPCGQNSQPSTVKRILFYFLIFYFDINGKKALKQRLKRILAHIIDLLLANKNLCQNIKLDSKFINCFQTHLIFFFMVIISVVIRSISIFITILDLCHLLILNQKKKIYVIYLSIFFFFLQILSLYLLILFLYIYIYIYIKFQDVYVYSTQGFFFFFLVS